MANRLTRTLLAASAALLPAGQTQSRQVKSHPPAPAIQHRPHNLIVFSYDKFETRDRTALITSDRRYAPGAAIVDVGLSDTEHQILRAVENEVRQRGTLDTLYIETHGGPNTLASDEYLKFGNTSTFNLLDDLKKLQDKLHVQITHRLQLSGCNVFTELTPDQVRNYRDAARNLGAEIAGNTTVGITQMTTGGFFSDPQYMEKYARVAGFRPDGYIGWDRTDSLSSHDPNIIKAALPKNLDASWFICYANRSQQQGDACENDALIRIQKPADDAIRAIFAKAESGYHTYRVYAHDHRDPILQMMSRPSFRNVPDATPRDLQLSAIPYSRWQQIYRQLGYKNEELTDFNQQEFMNANKGCPPFVLRFIDNHRAFINTLSTQEKRRLEHMVKPYLYVPDAVRQQTQRNNGCAGMARQDSTLNSKARTINAHLHKALLHPTA